MGNHEEKYGKDQVKQWEDAVKEGAKIKGRELKEKGKAHPSQTSAS